MFGKKKRVVKESYDVSAETPIIRSSICTGEKVAGFKNRKTGDFRDIMLIRNDADLKHFKEVYNINDKIPEEY